jgi:two-component system sensor histidine kinase MtrB
VRRPRRLPLVRLGLRDRVTIAFGLMALVLSTLLGIVTWTLVSHYLLTQRVDAARVATMDNAAVLAVGLQQGRPPTALLAGLPASGRSASLMSEDGKWFTTQADRDPSSVPAGLRKEALDGRAGHQMIRLDGEKYLVVGTPLPGRGCALFELFGLGTLERAYRVLAITLVGAGAATSLMGLLAGWYASRQALRPLREVTRATEEFARGNLDARIVEEGDPDLAGLASSFNRTADAFEQRVAADARFAGDLSHELRTPLTTMLNSMELLERRRADLPEQVREPLDLLAHDLDRFSGLVVDLIEISRDHAVGDHETERVWIGDLTARAADTAAGRPVTVVEAGARRLTVQADKRRLERVVANLVTNAETHGRRCLQVRVAGGDERATITVDDAGPGIAPEDRGRVFERFARVGHGSDNGVGLGLAIVERHVHWHGGTVDVSARPGGGARFVVVLPAAVGRRD